MERPFFGGETVYFDCRHYRSPAVQINSTVVENRTQPCSPYPESPCGPPTRLTFVKEYTARARSLPRPSVPSVEHLFDDFAPSGVARDG